MVDKKTVIFMVAGLSSRFGGKSKALEPVGPHNERLIEISMDQATTAGFNHIIFVVSPQTESMFKELYHNNYRGAKIDYALQTFDATKRDRPWGTCDALVSAISFIDDKAVICNGDDIYGESVFAELSKKYVYTNYDVMPGYMLFKTLSDTSSVNRAIVKVQEGIALLLGMKDMDFVETLEENFNLTPESVKANNMKNKQCSMNIFLLQRETIDLLAVCLDEFKRTTANDRKAECLLPKELNDLLAAKKIRLLMFDTNAQWCGLTAQDDVAKVRAILATKD